MKSKIQWIFGEVNPKGRAAQFHESGINTKKRNLKEKIIIEKRNRVSYISLYKPPANGYEIHLLKLLAEKIKTATADIEIKVVVIQSALEKFFCAGADIKIFAANTVEQNKEMVVVARSVSNLIMESPKIFIAALNGHTLGGGLELAMACDIRLAADGNFLLGLPEIKLGLMPGNGGAPRLINLIGAGRAIELLITGSPIQAEKALQYGLVNHIFPKEIFKREVEQYAEKLASGPAKAMAQVKYFNRHFMGMNVAQALDLEAKCVNPLYDTKDAKEAFQAFIEKRKPHFE